MAALDKYDFIDIHYHADPDLYQRRHNAIMAGKLYQKINGAVVLKSHLGATSVQATIAQKEGLPVLPSVVLNKIAGGIHYRPVLQALAEYQPTIPAKMLVHLPTITGRKHESKLSRQMINPYLANQLLQTETIFNDEGRLRPEVIDLLKISCDYPIILSTGHASKEETYALIDACEQWNVPALLLNQPANPMTGLKYKELSEIAKSNIVWIEQTALTFLLDYQSKEDISNVIKNIPRVIYSSDLGQTSQMDISDWIKISGEWFDKFNVSINRKREICLTNPLQLLKI